MMDMNNQSNHKKLLYLNDFFRKSPIDMKDIFCGHEHSYIIINQKIIAFGFDYRGKIGIGNVK